MMSAKLVHQIEDHWEAVAVRFLRLVRDCTRVPNLNRLPESEAIEVCRRLLRNLGHWLDTSSDETVRAQYEQVGRQRFRDGMPLSEALRAVQLLKDAAVGYIRDQGMRGDSVDLYAEEELEHELSRFFDLLMFHLARGYEQEQAGTTRTAVSHGA
jgi:hypothetical protein